MLNYHLRKKAVKKLENAVATYHAETEDIKIKSLALFAVRKKSVDVIRAAEKFVNNFANTPKEFDKTFLDFKAEYQVFTDTFTDTVAEFEKAGKYVSLKSAGTSVAGVAAGVVGAAALAPSTAKAIATTTFGTASTGTPIASLSGATITGGGVAVSHALLVLAAPVGLGIGAVTVIGTGLYASSKNKEIAEKAEKERAQHIVAAE